MHEAFPEQLIDSTDPFIIGVRHHSVALSHAVPALLEAAAPDVLFVELPSEFTEWIPWLTHAETVPPVALASAKPDQLGFYPFAAFSPEFVAMRWAARRDVEIVAFDTSVDLPGADAPTVLDGLDFSRLWDDSVETMAPGSTPEQIRIAALRIGWAMRAVHERVCDRDLARETHMRCQMDGRRGRAVAVAGAFHAAALLVEPIHWEAVEAPDPDGDAPVTSLLAYRDDLFDARSGYPAGVLDPAWHAAVYRALSDEEPIERVVERFAVRICRALRTSHVGGSSPDAIEMVRLANSLATLRRCPAPGRRELLEAATTVLAHGRVQTSFGPLQRAEAEVLVGDGRGAVPGAMPRCGLDRHVRDLLTELKLPGPGDAAKTLDLDARRTKLGRRRHVALRRLALAHVKYAKHEARTGVAGLPTMTERWTLEFSHGTAATLALASSFGVTLEQAAEGALRSRVARQGEDASAASQIVWLNEAAEAGLVAPFNTWITEWLSSLETGGLPVLVEVDDLIQRVQLGQVAGLAAPIDGGDANTAASAVVSLDGALKSLSVAMERAVIGVFGSGKLEDVRALGALVMRTEGVSLRLNHLITRMESEGSATMSGAATALLVVLEVRTTHELAEALGSWLDGASHPDGRRALRDRLTGLFAAAGTWLEGQPGAIGELALRVEELNDSDFLSRLVSLRQGFSALGEQGRRRFLHVLKDRIDLSAMGNVAIPPEWLVRFAMADRVAAQKVSDYPLIEATAGSAPVPETGAVADHSEATGDETVLLSPADRWRLILGRNDRSMGAYARRVAGVLGGAGGGASGGEGAGREKAVPSLREWTDELELLFGQEIRDEIIADTVGLRPALIEELDPERCRPSVDLLQQVLPLAGTLSEGALARLRPLVRRVVAEITRKLTQKMMPSLRGTPSPRPTRRRTDKLHLQRTIAGNLHTVRTVGGKSVMVPDKLTFRSRSKRSMHWEVSLLLDVSGSMERSVIYSAIIAAILSSVPWVRLQFLAFNTEIVDFSEQARDPLALLLSVEIGGGTDIGNAVSYARSTIRNPRRSLMIVVSDFEEFGQGGRLISEISAFVQSGGHALGVAALDEEGGAVYNVVMAKNLVSVGMPVGAMSPSALADWMAEKVR